ncbi:MAG: 50S ribosomal protein L13 [Planctomycetota bacterium]
MVLSKTTMMRPTDVNRHWFVVDASRYPLGRLASRVAEVLMGKHRPTFTPHIDTGDFVIITNAEKIALSGSKLANKEYQTYSMYPGGQRTIAISRWLDEKPEHVVRLAVRRMLPKSKLGRAMIKKLKVVKGTEHPHAAQRPEELIINKETNKPY